MGDSLTHETTPGRVRPEMRALLHLIVVLDG